MVNGKKVKPKIDLLSLSKQIKDAQIINTINRYVFSFVHNT